jgi:hypothetical protein
MRPSAGHPSVTRLPVGATGCGSLLLVLVATRELPLDLLLDALLPPPAHAIILRLKVIIIVVIALLAQQKTDKYVHN